jgi:heat shock protein HtpX
VAFWYNGLARQRGVLITSKFHIEERFLSGAEIGTSRNNDYGMRAEVEIMNLFKTTILLTALTLILVLAGEYFGGIQGATIGLIVALAINGISYWFSDKIVLAIYGARQVSPDEAPELYDIVEELVARARLPMPRLYVIPSDAPNAFATGRNPNHAAVAVTKGALSLLDREELKGVLGHELAHVKNRDILIATVAAAIAGAITLIARMAQFAYIFGGSASRRDDRDGGGPLGALVMFIVAPIAALLIQLAISRSREYAADQRGASFAGSPAGLANALAKLEQSARYHRMNVAPSTAHMFIVNPLRGDFIATLFSTHPPIQKRIARLTRGSREI